MIFGSIQRVTVYIQHIYIHIVFRGIARIRDCELLRLPILTLTVILWMND